MTTFDRFADWVAEKVASAVFFIFCVVLCIVWLPTIFIPHMSVDTWQLIINTLTTIITFLMVSLLHNTQHRFEYATNSRLQHLLETLEATHDPVQDEGQKS